MFDVFANDVSNTGSMKNIIINAVPILFFMTCFYLLLIKPNNAKIAKTKEVIESLKVNDVIETCFGIVGKVKKIKAETVIIETGNSEIEILKNSIEKKTKV